MSFREMQLEKALAQPGCAVFYFYSTQEFLVRDAAQKAVHHLMQAGDAELTRIEGPSPDIGEAVAAAGTISLFGTKRVVEMPRVTARRHGREGRGGPVRLDAEPGKRRDGTDHRVQRRQGQRLPKRPSC